MPDVIVFAGPSVSHRLRGAYPDVAWRPPARRGDVLAVLVERPHTVVLIDGYYYQVAAVTHKELMYAIDADVRVVGAASLGALRAAELHRHGMEGVGQVFEWFRTGSLDGDDEVAVLHGPAELEYAATTIALVELREAVDHVVRRTGVNPAAAARVVAHIKGLPFQARSTSTVTEHLRAEIGEAGANEVLDRMARRGVKARDADLALARATSSPSPACPRPTPPRRRLDGYLATDLALHVRPPGASTTLLEAFQCAQVLHPEASSFVRAVQRRWLINSLADDAGRRPTSEAIREWARILSSAGPDTHPPMPEPEVWREAEACATYDAVLAECASDANALALVSERLGLPRSTPERVLLQLVVGTDLPLWELVRAFAYTAALAPARAASRAVAEVHEYFLDWSEGSRVRVDDLWQAAREIWGCTSEDVRAEAAGRGLYEADARGAGFREALERVAVAERLPAPVNDYPDACVCLRGACIDPIWRSTVGSV